MSRRIWQNERGIDSSSYKFSANVSRPSTLNRSSSMMKQNALNNDINQSIRTSKWLIDMKSSNFPQLIIVIHMENAYSVRFPNLSLSPPHNFICNWHKSLLEHAILKLFSTIFCASNNKARSLEIEILEISSRSI
jgi:hypothetical protein